MGFPVPFLDIEYELALIRSPSVIPAIDPDPNLGLSENRGYPQIAILMGNMVIIHWNMRYTIFRQTHLDYQM